MWARVLSWLDRGIRLGLVAYGVVHLLIGWLGLQLAFGDRPSGPRAPTPCRSSRANRSVRGSAALTHRTVAVRVAR